MSNRSVVRILAIAALVVAGAAAVGIGAYNAGVAQGIAESGRAITAPGTPYVYVWPRPWGFGYFPIFPLFFFLFFFFVIRSLLWRGPWRGPWGRGYDTVPPAFEEWHRRAHAEQGTPKPPAGTTS